MFSPTSRYAGLATATHVSPEGREIVFVQRRFPPAASGDALEHTVVQGDRLDNISARSLGDPEAFWRICDANGATRPDALTATVGRVLRIPLFGGGSR